ncbi:MAG: arsenate reductase ArsC [Pseudomonadota bacterium]
MNVLFLCTGNSARSILGECLMSHLGAPAHRGYSAGSHPVGVVNAGALRALQRHAVSAAGARSKSWDEFADNSTPVMDIVITVCDNAAGESCPIWPGHPVKSHWGLSDPAAVSGELAVIDAAFETTFQVLAKRLAKLVECLSRELDSAELAAELDRLAGVS